MMMARYTWLHWVAFLNGAQFPFQLYDDDDDDGDDVYDGDDDQFDKDYVYDENDDDGKVYLTPLGCFPQGSLLDSVSTLSLHHLFHFQFMDSQQIYRSTPSSSPQS